MYPLIKIKFTIRQNSKEVEAYIDTSFGGYLILPLEYTLDFEKPDCDITICLQDGLLKERCHLYTGKIEIERESGDWLLIERAGIICWGFRYCFIGRQIFNKIDICFKGRDKKIIIR